LALPPTFWVTVGVREDGRGAVQTAEGTVRIGEKKDAGGIAAAAGGERRNFTPRDIYCRSCPGSLLPSRETLGGTRRQLAACQKRKRASAPQRGGSLPPSLAAEPDFG
jgi:hypothetical protein